MKKILRVFIILCLTVFSFYYTNKIVSLSKVNSVEKPMNQTTITTVTADEWASFLALNPKAAIYNEDGSYKGVSPTTNCYAPNNYYIKGSQFGGLINTWVKVI